MSTSTLVLDLDAPQDGITPTAEANLHEDELKRVVRRLRARAIEARRARREANDDDGERGRGRDADTESSQRRCAPRRASFAELRRGILIDADRGVGKTTFLRAIADTVNEVKRFKREGAEEADVNRDLRIRVLRLLDPTLIDGDRIFLATVVANILNDVEHARDGRDLCSPGCRTDEQRMAKALQQLHQGLAASTDESWKALTKDLSTDTRFVDQLVGLARGGIVLAERFECFVRAAARLLDVDMFVQPIDDVDLAQEEAWITLEAVRRYLSGPSLIPVVAAHTQKLEATVLQSYVKADKVLLDYLSGKAGEGARTTSASAHAALLDAQTAQYLSKLFLIDDRVALTSQRDRVLRWALVRMPGTDGGAGGVVPIDRAPWPPDPGPGGVRGPTPASGTLLQRVAARLTPGASRADGRAIRELVPERTRSLMDALRAMRQIAIAPLPGAGELSPALQRGLEKLIAAITDLIRPAGIQPADLLSLIRSGVEPQHVAMVASRWAQLSAINVAIDLRPDPATTMLEIALTMAVRDDPALSLAAMSRLFRVAGALTPTQATAVAHVGERGFSWAGTATAVEHMQRAGAWQLPHGLELRWRDQLIARPEQLRKHVVALRRHAGLVINEATPWLALWADPGYRDRQSVQMQGDGPANSGGGPTFTEHPWRNSLALSIQELGAVNQGASNDAYLAACLFGSRVAGEGDWVVDPPRGLEGVARLVQLWRRGPEEMTTDALRGQLRDLCALRLDPTHAQVPDELRQAARADEPNPRRFTSGPAGPAAVVTDGLLEAIKAWLREAEKQHEVVAAATVARVTQRWLRGLREHTDSAPSRLCTLGGFLERAVLTLMHAAAIEEVFEAANQAQIPEPQVIELAQLLASLPRLGQPPTYRVIRHKAPENASGSPEPGKGWPWRLEPDGDLVKLAGAVSIIQKTGTPAAGSNTPPPMPLTKMLWSCPLLHVCLGADWSEVVKMALAGSLPAKPTSQPSPTNTTGPDLLEILDGTFAGSLTAEPTTQPSHNNPTGDEHTAYVWLCAVPFVTEPHGPGQSEAIDAAQWFDDRFGSPNGQDRRDPGLPRKRKEREDGKGSGLPTGAAGSNDSGVGEDFEGTHAPSNKPAGEGDQTTDTAQTSDKANGDDADTAVDAPSAHGDEADKKPE